MKIKMKKEKTIKHVLTQKKKKIQKYIFHKENKIFFVVDDKIR